MNLPGAIGLAVCLAWAGGFAPAPEPGDPRVAFSDAPSVQSPAPEEPPRRSLLLIDDAAVPDMRVRWRASGGPVEVEGPRPFGSPDDVVHFEGTNIDGSVSLGGTRLRVGLGDPNGAILRVEIRKHVEARALFPGVEPGSSFTLEVSGVRFNQPVRVVEDTALMHLRYSSADVQACALPPDATSQFLLADPDDTLGGSVATGINATPGGLSGDDGAGSVQAFVDDDGLVTLRVELPYGMLRHLQDPWASDLPGTFFEPIRLHAEVEVIPAWAEPMVRNHAPIDEPFVRPSLGD